MLLEIISIIGTTLMYSTPLVFGAMGGVISERSGVVNIGIEGMMSIGAFTAATVGYYSGNPWIGFLAGGLAGAGLALLLGIVAITCRANQTIAGIAINMIGPGLSLFLARLFFEGSSQTKRVDKKLPRIFGEDVVDNPILSRLNVEITVLLAVMLVVILWFVLYKTKWGLRIRSVGEHPAAADTLGVNVSRMRYLCVIMSGMFAGFGGASVTLAVVSQFSPTAISGQGFIALAAVIFGKWTPFGAYGACALFGFAQALVVAGGDKFIPSSIFNMLPYVITILVLILFVGKSVAPKADGIPYEKGSR